ACSDSVSTGRSNRATRSRQAASSPLTSPSTPSFPATTSIPARFPPDAGMRPDELQAPSENDLGVVVQGCDVIAISQLANIQLALRQGGAKHLQAGRPDHVIGAAAIDQDGLGQVAEMILGDAP